MDPEQEDALDAELEDVPGYEPPEPEEPQAWQTYDLFTAEDGTIRGTASTNDDNDDGYPDGDISRWEVSYQNRAEMLKRTGGTHYGCSGIHVLVYLDLQEVKP